MEETNSYPYLKPYVLIASSLTIQYTHISSKIFRKETTELADIFTYSMSDTQI